MDLFGTAGIRGDARERVTPELALAVGRAIGIDAAGTSTSSDSDSDSNASSDDRSSDDGDGDREPTSAEHRAGRDGRGWPIGAGDEADGTANPTTATAGGVVIGRDGRVTGTALLAALEAGIESAGARVHRAGVLPTPALAYASRGRRGVMVTASHNPPADNGIKCFEDGEEYDRAGEGRIERRVAERVEPVAFEEWETGERIEPLLGYREAVRTYARGHGTSLEGLTVAVDCANGVSGLATPQVLRALGAKVVALHANVDGFFPGRPSKPTAETLGDLRAFVAGESGTANEGREEGEESEADTTSETGEMSDGSDVDLAIAHDGDGDRVVVLDGEGEIVHEDTIVAILAERYTRASDAGDPVVVTTPNASSRIDERVEAAGGRIERVQLGALHEGIAAAREDGTEETSVVFAAEPWKHIHPAFGPWIDGVVSAAVVSRLVADADLDILRGPIAEQPYEKTEVDCPDERKRDAMDRLETRLPEAFPGATVTTEHGVRLDMDAGDGAGAESGEAETGAGDGEDRDETVAGGWVLVRPSGTEPYLRIYVESESVGAVRDRVLGVVESAIGDAERE